MGGMLERVGGIGGLWLGVPRGLLFRFAVFAAILHSPQGSLLRDILVGQRK